MRFAAAAREIADAAHVAGPFLHADHAARLQQLDELAQRAGDADVEMCVHEVTSMFHVWMTRAIPEGWRTRQRLVEIVQHRTRTASCGPSGT